MRDDIVRKKTGQSIDELNEKLYQTDATFENKRRRVIHDKNIQLEKDFDDTEYEKMLKKKVKRKLPKSLFRRIFIGVSAFFVFSVIIALFSIFGEKSTVSKDLISMEILAQPLVDGGETLELQVRIQNFNEQTLELPDLILSYKKDSYIEGNEVFLRRSLDDITNGGRINEEFNIVLFGQEGDIRDIVATLEYRIEGSSSIFVKETDHEVVIRSTPTSLAIDAPDILTKNQEINIDFQIASNTINQVNNGLLKIEFPEGFEFLTSSVVPSYGNNIWEIPSLSDIGETITVTGRLAALEGQGQSIKAFFGKQDILQKRDLETIFNTAIHTVNVEKSFIDTRLEINGQNKSIVAVRGGGTIEGEILFENTLEERLKDVAITLNFNGNLYDEKNVLTFSGYYDSNTRSIVWDKNSIEDFSFIEPGEEGSVSFSLNVPDLINFGASVEPSLILSVDVSAVENDGTVLSAKSVARSEVRGNSDIQIVAKTVHHSGPFSNLGPLPPKVGQTTDYTIILDVINSTNEVKNAKLHTILPPYMTWKNQVSPSSERSSVSFNTATREVIWNIGTLQSGLGIGETDPKEISFQVEILPSISQLGVAPDITGDIVLSGTDSFTDVELSFTKRGLTTRLINDTSDVGADGKVVE